MKAIGYFHTIGTRDTESALILQQSSYSIYCETQEYEPTESFVETSDGDENRPIYNELLDYLRTSKTEFLVIIAGIQYLGDTLESAVRRVLELDELGARVLCSDPHLSDPLQQAVKYWRGGAVRGRKSASIKEAMMAKAIRGEGLGKPPYGYKIGTGSRLEIMPEESEAVRTIFRLYNHNDMGMRKIVRHLNQQGIPTRGGRGWSIVTIRDILRNRSYVGTYTRFGMLVPRSHQPIINSNEFNMSQKKMLDGQIRRVSRPVQPFLLSGLAYCSECGNHMIGVTRRQAWQRKDGTKSLGQYRYYQCQSRTNQGMCRYHTWRADKLEDLVLQDTRDALSDLTLGKKLIESAQKNYEPVKGTSKRVYNQFIRAVESASTGTTPLGVLRSALSEVDSMKSSPSDDSHTNDVFSLSVSTKDPSILLGHLDSMDVKTLGITIRKLVSRITVWDNRITTSLVE